MATRVGRIRRNGMSWWMRVKALFKRRQLDRDLEDELAFHLAMREAKNRARDMEGVEARYAARRPFGTLRGSRKRAGKRGASCRWKLVGMICATERERLRRIRGSRGGAFVKVRKKAALVVGILALVVCAELIREYTAPMRGRLKARYDVWRGHYAVLAYGLPPPWRPQYAHLLRERYGIEVRTIALCIVSETLRSYADSYDEVSAAAASHKFGHDVFKECAEVARSQWEQR